MLRRECTVSALYHGCYYSIMHLIALFPRLMQWPSCSVLFFCVESIEGLIIGESVLLSRFTAGLVSLIGVINTALSFSDSG